MYTDFTFWDEPRYHVKPSLRASDEGPHESHHEGKASVPGYRIEDREVGVIADVVGGYAPRYNPSGKAYPGEPPEVKIEMFWIAGGERHEMHEVDYERLREEAETLALKHAA